MKRIKVKLMLLIIMAKLSLIDLFSISNLNRLYEKVITDSNNRGNSISWSDLLLIYVMILIVGIILLPIIIVSLLIVIITSGSNKRWMRFSYSDRIVILRSILENKSFKYNSPYKNIYH